MPLRLRNNTGNGTEQNLCFVNCIIQVLNNIPEFKEYFTSRGYKSNFKGKLPISDELSRLLSFKANVSTSAATLRTLVSQESKRYYLADGSQQDACEFLDTLLQELRNEFKENGITTGDEILEKFSGWEERSKKFLDTNNGFCYTCGMGPRKEVERFNSLKFPVKQTSSVISLRDLARDYFKDGGSILDMRCSYCQVGSNKSVSCTTSISVSPEYLIIVLLKNQSHIKAKVDTLVVPENILTLPNGDQFELKSISDHIGDFIYNGHYTATLKQNNVWIKCNDERSSIIEPSLVGNRNNYIYVYHKLFQRPNQAVQIYDTKVRKDDSVANNKLKGCVNDKNRKKNHIEETYAFRKETECIDNSHQANVKDSLDSKCLQCSKKVNNIWLHLKRSDSCQKCYDMQSVEENHKKKLRERKNETRKARRENLDEDSRKFSKERDKIRKRLARKTQDEETKKVSNQNNKTRMRVTREAQDEETKKLSNQNNRIRMRVAR